MSLPFDGAISAFYNDSAPQDIRDAIRSRKKGRILSESYPYDRRMDRAAYETLMAALQIELVKLQAHIRDAGLRIAIVFEGRDAAGKGGTIKRFRENLNPRVARSIALSKPTEHEKGEWYFQRYIKHLPSAGEITMFDRSWYNRGVVGKVFEFCTDDQRAHFFKQTPEVEEMIVDEGIIFVKLWLNVGRAEQLRRFLDRENDPLKQWKLSWIDVEGLKRWDAYSMAIEETFVATSTAHAPWTVIRSDDKRRARVAAIQTVLSQVDYPEKDHDVVASPDPKVTGGPEIWSATDHA